MNVAILHEALPANARPDESDVLDQVAAVAAALDALGHASWTVASTADVTGTARRLAASRPDVVFNLVEAIDGRGERIDAMPAALAAAGLAFTGSGAEATRLAASKLATKLELAACGLPTPPWATLDALRNGASPPPTSPCLVKSVWEHGSLGLDDDCVVAVVDAPRLCTEIEQRRVRMGGEAFAESYVHGREFNLAMLAHGREFEHLPAAEIRFTSRDDAPRIVGYDAKWRPDSDDDRATPRRFDVAPGDRSLVDAMRELAGQVWRRFRMAGYARVDFRVDESGAPWIIDVNTNPCLSPDAGFAAALVEAGIPFSIAVDRILHAAALTPS